MNVPIEPIEVELAHNEDNRQVAMVQDPIKVQAPPETPERAGSSSERGYAGPDKDLIVDRIGGWTPEQNNAYLQFLVDNSEFFQNERVRRREKVFFRLSQVVKTRTPEQCRSHHQKLVMKFGKNFVAIEKFLRRKLFLSMRGKEYDQGLCSRAFEAQPRQRPTQVSHPPSKMSEVNGRSVAEESEKGVKVRPNVIRIVLKTSLIPCY